MLTLRFIRYIDGREVIDDHLLPTAKAMTLYHTLKEPMFKSFWHKIQILICGRLEQETILS